MTDYNEFGDPNTEDDGAIPVLACDMRAGWQWLVVPVLIAGMVICLALGIIVWAVW